MVIGKIDCLHYQKLITCSQSYNKAFRKSSAPGLNRLSICVCMQQAEQVMSKEVNQHTNCQSLQTCVLSEELPGQNSPPLLSNRSTPLANIASHVDTLLSNTDFSLHSQYGDASRCTQGS